jgi:hypothetical protein
VSSSYFDRFPRFYDTGEASPGRDRLNLRYEAIFAEHRDVFEGARVLDISSHDGRWSLAALETGARSVIGIEARPELIETSAATLTECGADPASYSFVEGDVFEVLARQSFDVDVVLCLGFFYHTMRHTELLHLITRLRPRYLMLDTEVATQSDGLMMEIHREHSHKPWNAVNDSYLPDGMVLVGKPNIAALRMMLDTFGYEVERFSDWRGLLRDNPDLSGVADYRKLKRVTVRCRLGD